MWKACLAATVLTCVGALPGHTADLAQVGPQASAAQITAARGNLSEPILRIVFDVSGGSHTAPATMTIDLAPDYVFVRDEKSSTIYDYKLRRIIELDEPQHRFSNGSLYATADFRFAETFNRRYERRLLSAAKVEQAADMFDPFWVQSELHVMDPADPVPVVDRRSATDGIHFSYKSNEIAAFSFSEEKIGASEKTAFGHVLQERTILHPSIIAALLADDRLPERLSFAMPPIRKKDAELWVLRSAGRMTATYPLTGDYVAEQTKAGIGSTALAGLVPFMLDAVAGRAGSGPRPVAQYHALIDEALRKKAGLQAVLLAFEVNEQYGEPSLACVGQTPACHSMKDVVTQSQADPRVNDLIHSFEIERATPNDAIKLRQNLRRDDVINGYVIDGFIGNALGSTGHADQALPLLIGEVRGDPYVAGYYKDLGDLFRRSFKPAEAWLCYDLGRVLPGGPSAPVINTINGYEAQLAAKLPQFF